MNPGVFLAGMLIGAPVCGFRPVRAFLERTIKVPNPVTTTLSPFLSESVMEPNTAPTASDKSGTNGRVPLGANGTGDDAQTFSQSLNENGFSGT